MNRPMMIVAAGLVGLLFGLGLIVAELVEKNSLQAKHCIWRYLLHPWQTA